MLSALCSASLVLAAPTAGAAQTIAVAPGGSYEIGAESGEPISFAADSVAVPLVVAGIGLSVVVALVPSPAGVAPQASTSVAIEFSYGTIVAGDDSPLVRAVLDATAPPESATVSISIPVPPPPVEPPPAPGTGPGPPPPQQPQPPQQPPNQGTTGPLPLPSSPTPVPAPLPDRPGPPDSVSTSWVPDRVTTRSVEETGAAPAPGTSTSATPTQGRTGVALEGGPTGSAGTLVPVSALGDVAGDPGMSAAGPGMALPFALGLAPILAITAASVLATAVIAEARAQRQLRR